MSAEQMTTGMDDTVSPNAAGFGLSYAITSILSALLVVAKETSHGIHDFLASITGHHWVTHGILDVIVFLVLGFVLSRGATSMSGGTLVKAVVGSTIISGLIITGYFI